MLVPRARVDEFVAAMQRAVAAMYPTIAANPDYTSIVSDRHYQRLARLVADAQARGATVDSAWPPAARRRTPATRKFPPTLLVGVDDDMAVMREEIFGPLLPVIAVRLARRGDRVREPRIRARSRSTGSARAREHRDRVLRGTISGGVTINDACWHVAQEYLPFGGVGASGMGAYHGERGFLTFTQEKPVFHAGAAQRDRAVPAAVRPALRGPARPAEALLLNARPFTPPGAPPCSKD